MRTIVEFSETQIQALDALSRRQKQSRAAVIRRAVDTYVSQNRKDAIEAGFGLWKDKAEDGLVYQERMRSEW